MTAAAEVHHIVPLSAGGTHDESNLMALCKPCHSRITAREGGRWAKVACREPQGPLNSQKDAHAIAGPPLRAIFRDFKKGI